MTKTKSDDGAFTNVELTLRVAIKGYAPNFFKEFCEYVLGRDSSGHVDEKSEFTKSFFGDLGLDIDDDDCHPLEELLVRRMTGYPAHDFYGEVPTATSSIDVFLGRLPTKEEWEILEKRINGFFGFKFQPSKKSKIESMTIITTTTTIVTTEQQAGLVFYEKPVKAPRVNKKSSKKKPSKQKR